jgi:arabinose-5-phosphate isomerase
LLSNGSTCTDRCVEGLTQNQYAMNHPAGRIGKRLVLKVTDVMKPWGDLPLVKPSVNGMETLVHMVGLLACSS